MAARSGRRLLLSGFEVAKERRALMKLISGQGGILMESFPQDLVIPFPLIAHTLFLILTFCSAGYKESTDATYMMTLLQFAAGIGKARCSHCQEWQ